MALQTIKQIAYFAALRNSSPWVQSDHTTTRRQYNCQTVPAASDLDIRFRDKPATPTACGRVFRLGRVSHHFIEEGREFESDFASAAIDQVLLILLSPEWSVACFDRPGLPSPRTFLGGLALVAAYPAGIYWSGNPQHSCLSVSLHAGIEHPIRTRTCYSRPLFPLQHPSLGSYEYKACWIVFR